MIPIPYGDENSGPSDPTPIVALVAANILVFGLWRTPEIFDRWGFIPNRAAPATWITYQFLHTGAGHIVGNMWALWIFGDNVAARLRRFFLPFYFAGGIASAAFFRFTHPGTAAPLIGASGAICAVIGAYGVLYPRARIRCYVVGLGGLFNRMSLSALLFSGLYLFGQIVAPMLSDQPVAYSAHIGGLFFGMLIGLLVDAFAPERAIAHSGLIGEGPVDEAELLDVEQALADGDDALAANLFAQVTRRNPYAELADPREQLRVADALCDAGQAHLSRVALERFLLRRSDHELAPSALDLLGYVEETYFKDFASALERFQAAAVHPRATPEQKADALKRVAEVRSILDKHAVDPLTQADLCAVVSEAAPPLSAAALLSVGSILDTTPSPRSGFLARGIPAQKACRAAQELERAGVHVVVIPENRVVKTPPPTFAPRLAADESGLTFVLPDDRRIAIPWADCSLISAFQVRTLDPQILGIFQVEDDDELGSESERVEGTAPARCLDVVTTDLRRYQWVCDEETPFFDTLRSVVEQAPNVPVDYGAQCAFDGQLPDELSFHSGEEAEDYVNWQVQLARLKRAKAYA